MGGLVPRPLTRLTASVVLLLLALAPGAQAARSWREPIQLSSGGATVEFANVDRAGDDGAVVATWLEDETGDLRAAFKAPGDSEVATQTLGRAWWSRTALRSSPTGDTVAAWVSWPDSRLQVTAVDPDSNRFRDPADFGPAQEASAPALAANANGDYLLAFVRETADGAAIWSMRRPHGGAWTEPSKVVDVERESDWKRQLQVALARNGDAVLVWSDEVRDDDQRVRAVTQSADGVVGAVQELSTPGQKAWNPRIAMDALGEAVVAWVEVPPGDWEGPVRASVSLPTGLFRPAVELLGTGGDWDPVAVGTGSLGNAVVTWWDTRTGLRFSTGVLATGVFAPGLLLPNDATGADPAMATDDDGNALIVGQGWRTRELRVIRRSALGIPGQARNVSCPAPHAGLPVAATVDDSGNASFVWREVDSLAYHSLFLAQDEASSEFSPDPCPPRRPWLGWAPKEPDPGDTVTFDGSGTGDWSASDGFRYAWDFDDDGTFEVDNGSDPVATHVFDTEGLHTIRYRVTERSHRDGDEGSQVGEYTVRVGLPHLDLVDEDPPGWDRRPPDLPDENPWPLEPPVDVPPVDVPPVDVPPVDVPPVDVPPVDVPPADVPPADTPPVDTPPADTPPVLAPSAQTPGDPPAGATAPPDQPPGDGSTGEAPDTAGGEGPPVEVPPIVVAPPETPPAGPPPQILAPGVDLNEAMRHLVGPTTPPPAATPGLTVRMPGRMRRGAALRRGLTLTLSSGQPLSVSIRALVNRRGVLTAAAKLRASVTPSRPLTARVRLPRWAKTSLARRKRGRVTIEIGAAAVRGAGQVVRRGVTLVP